MADDYTTDPEWEYGFRLDDNPGVHCFVFGLPITSLAMAEHAAVKSYTTSIEYMRHPKGSRRLDDWEPVPDGS